MKSASAVLLLAQCAQVSGFAPVPPAMPGARLRGSPIAVGGLLQARNFGCAAAARVAPGALEMAFAGLSDAKSNRPHVLQDATRLSHAVWQRVTAFLRSVVVKIALLASFFLMSPALAGAAPALDTRGTAATEILAPAAAASRQARVVLVAQAMPAPTLQDHLTEALKHAAAATSSAVGQLTSPLQPKFEETIKPLKDAVKPTWDKHVKPTWEGTVKPAWEGTIKPGAKQLAARASTLLHETLDSAKSLVDGSGGKDVAAPQATKIAETVYRTKMYSSIPHPEAAPSDADLPTAYPEWKVA
jgi:hypothetical protein